MKNTTILKKTGGGLIAAFALMSTSAVFAGDTYTEPAPVMPPAAQPSLWNWFIGASANYVDEWEDEMWAFHVGAEKICGSTSHAFYLEVGWAGDDDSDYLDVASTGGALRWADWDIDLVPVTLNYKFERPLFNSQRLNWYAGVGLGVLFSDADWSTYFDDGIVGPIEDGRGSNSDERFFGQVFAGLVWNLSESFEIYGGGRWMYVDTASDFDVEDNTAAGELGIRWNF